MTDDGYLVYYKCCADHSILTTVLW